MKKFIASGGTIALLVFLVGSNQVLADSTIGTNMSTTGTFTQTVGSATAARFQNAAGTTTVFQVDTTNTRAGVNPGGAVDTTFEVGGTASISGIITLAGGQIRPQANGTTAFRFQNAAGTTNVLTIDTTNTRVGVNAGGDVDTTFEVGGTASISGLALFGNNASVAGNFELTGASALLGVIAGGNINTTLEVGGTASISGIITLAGGQIRPQANGTTAFRFQNAAGGADVLTIDTSNTRVGIGTTPVTVFEVQGTASASYLLIGNTIQVGGWASVAYSRFGTSATTHANFITTTNDLLVNGDLEVDASAQFDSFVQMSGAATTSFTVKSSSGTQGACLELKDYNGDGYTYLRVSGGVATFSTTSCK